MHAASVLQSARALSGDDKRFVEEWLREASDWGLNAICKAVGGGPDIVIELYGPLELVPVAIVYQAADDEFVLEWFDQEFYETTSIADALDYFAHPYPQ